MVDVDQLLVRNLLDLSWSGEVESLKKFFVENDTLDVNVAKDHLGVTALHQACKTQQVDAVKYLIEQRNADVNVRGYIGYTAMHYAAYQGANTLLEYLASKEGNMHCRSDEGDSLLHESCTGGHLETVRMLLRNGLDINGQDKDGVTPLISACRSGHLAIVELLLDSGADMNITSTFGPAIVVCAQQQQFHIFEYLVKRGADMFTVDPATNTTALSLLWHSCCNFESNSYFATLPEEVLETLVNSFDYSFDQSTQKMSFQTKLHSIVASTSIANINAVINLGANPYIVCSDEKDAMFLIEQCGDKAARHEALLRYNDITKMKQKKRIVAANLQTFDDVIFTAYYDESSPFINMIPAEIVCMCRDFVGLLSDAELESVLASQVDIQLRQKCDS